MNSKLRYLEQAVVLLLQIMYSSNVSRSSYYLYCVWFEIGILFDTKVYTSVNKIRLRMMAKVIIEICVLLLINSVGCGVYEYTLVSP